MALKPRIVLVHGWGRGGRREAVLCLAGALRRLDYEVVVPSYGSVWGRSKTLHVSRQVAKVWSNRVRAGDVLVGHSNGGRVAWEMSYYTGGKVRTVVLLNPALDPWLTPGPGVTKCHVFHNHDDVATLLAMLIPNSNWGEMGRVGYQARDDGWGPDPRMENHDFGSGHAPFEDPEVATNLAIYLNALIVDEPVRL